MLFKIKRVSDYSVKPCQNAFVKEEIQTVKSDRIRDEKGRFVKRTQERKVSYWAIEIETLEELVELCKEVNEPLVMDAEAIMILDEYVE